MSNGSGQRRQCAELEVKLACSLKDECGDDHEISLALLPLIYEFILVSRNGLGG